MGDVAGASPVGRIMAAIDSMLGRVEKYGLERRFFPMEYNGHHLEILCNDAYIAADGRLLFDLSLRCMQCKRERVLSGRFPHDCDNQIELVAMAKVAVFDKFYVNECQ